MGYDITMWKWESHEERRPGLLYLMLSKGYLRLAVLVEEPLVLVFTRPGHYGVGLHIKTGKVRWTHNQ